MRKKANKNEIMVINLSSHKIPEFRETRGKDWVYFGKNNDYPDYLLKLYNRSAKHNAIVNQKAFYILGNGFGKAGEIVVNSDGETLNDVAKKVILDYVLSGCFPLETIWAKNGKLAEMRHVDFSNVRSNEDNTEFYYTKHWLKKYASEDKEEDSYPVGNPDKNDDWEVYAPFSTAGKGKQLFYYKSYRPSLLTYSLPEYIGCIPYIELDFEIANYWYNAVKNGFTASHIITFFADQPVDEEQKKLEEKIKAKFTGTDNAGRIILNFSNNKENGGSEITNIVPQDLDKIFQILNKTVQEEIFSGHRITSPMLMGIRTEGQLGGRNELIEANELFQNIYISPMQRLFEREFAKLMKYFGVKEEIKITKIEPIGMDLINNNNAWSILKSDEKRELIGKDPLPKELAPPVVTTTPPAVLPKPALPKNPIHNKAIESFLAKGQIRKGRVLSSRSVDVEFIKLGEVEKQYMAELTDVTLRPVELSVIDLLEKDNLMSAENIGKVIGKSAKEVSKIIQGLKEKDLLKENKGALIPVPDAKKILGETPAPTEEIIVEYSYEWREGFSDDDKGASRNFCIETRDASRLGKRWLRGDIETLSNDLDTDVWSTRGGWYTLPETDTHRPSCRHIWKQHAKLIQR